jgi:hypothetical protein
MSLREGVRGRPWARQRLLEAGALFGGEWIK